MKIDELKKEVEELKAANKDMMKKEKKSLKKLRQKAEKVKADNKNIEKDVEVLRDINKNVFDKEDIKPVILPNCSDVKYFEVHQPANMEPFLPLPELTPVTTCTPPKGRPSSCAPPNPYTHPGLPPCYSLNSGQPLATLSTYFGDEPTDLIEDPSKTSDMKEYITNIGKISLLPQIRRTEGD